jgi:hypothetical protein
MKLEIRTETSKLDLFGTEPEEIWPQREVYINDQKCPPGLRDIILTGIDNMCDHYLNQVETIMEENQ